MRLLVILWNPGEKEIAAGGFRRAFEILKRFTAEDGELQIIDAQPSFCASLESRWCHLHTYKIPRWIKRLERQFYSLERILEWNYAIWAILLRARRLRRQYDLVYVPYSEIAVMFIPGALIKLFLGKRVVFCNLNTDDGWLKRILDNLTHNYVDRVFTISKDLAAGLERQGIKGPLAINYTGLDLSLLNKVRESVKKYDAIFIGRHVESKGIFDYINMLPQVVKSFPDFKLLTVGACAPDVQDEIERRLDEVGLRKHWEFAGIVDETAKYKLLKQSKLMWFLSTVEGWGIAPQEALACGVLPICYDLPVYKESIRECAAPAFVKTGDWEAAAAQTEHLLKLPPVKRAKLEKIGRDFVKRFDWEVVARREFGIIEGTDKETDQ